MKLAAYSFGVSLTWAAVTLYSPQLARPMLVGFVALLLVPACLHLRRRQR